MTATKKLLDMVDRQDFPAQGEEGNSLDERLHELVNAELEEWECADLLELFAAERQRTVLRCSNTWRPSTGYRCCKDFVGTTCCRPSCRRSANSPD